jgi:hypothetical protein
MYCLDPRDIDRARKGIADIRLVISTDLGVGGPIVGAVYAPYLQRVGRQRGRCWTLAPR